MITVAIIGGSGLTNLKNLKITRREVMRTPYGEPSAPLVYGELAGQEVVFLPRHGAGHTIPPHGVNYRANIWALKQTGVARVIAVNAVGGIASGYLSSERLVLPDQIIDYTYDRKHTFFGNDLQQVTHIDFTEPYCGLSFASCLSKPRSLPSCPVSITVPMAPPRARASRVQPRSGAWSATAPTSSA